MYFDYNYRILIIITELTEIDLNKQGCRLNFFVKYLYKSHFDNVQKMHYNLAC